MPRYVATNIDYSNPEIKEFIEDCMTDRILEKYNHHIACEETVNRVHQDYYSRMVSIFSETCIIYSSDIIVSLLQKGGSYSLSVRFVGELKLLWDVVKEHYDQYNQPSIAKEFIRYFNLFKYEFDPFKNLDPAHGVSTSSECDLFKMIWTVVYNKWISPNQLYDIITEKSNLKAFGLVAIECSDGSIHINYSDDAYNDRNHSTVAIVLDRYSNLRKFNYGAIRSYNTTEHGPITSDVVLDTFNNSKHLF